MEQEKTDVLQEKIAKEQIHHVKEIVYNETVNVPLDLSKADVEFKEFWRDNNRFADLFNGSLFQGETILHAEDLKESDTDVSGVIETLEVRESLQRIRDVVKKAAYGTEFILLGLENQMGIHYAMPLRTMVYDALGYVKEVKEIGKRRAVEKPKMTGDEFLSGFGKDDIITPIITIVIYYGKNPWDGPRSLTEMMPSLPEPVKNFISDYKMNLVEVLEKDSDHFHQEDVKLLFAYTQAFIKKDKEKVEELNHKYNIKKDVVYMIGKIVDGTNLLKIREEDEGESNMCEYLQDIWDEGWLKGELDGRMKGELDGRMKGELDGRMKGKLEDIESIRESLHVTMEEAMDILKISEEDRKKYMELV
ncbi:MAG: Rpn family recombination-promoting nuclease/putative transposase [Eubacteriales bacterium]